MFLTSNRRGMGGLRRTRPMRGLGTVSTQVGNSLVYGSSPVSQIRFPQPIWGGNPPRTSPIRIGVPVTPSPSAPICPAWGCNGPPSTIYNNPTRVSVPNPTYGGGYNYRSQYGSQGSQYGSQMNSQSLATAQALLSTNPSLLTQAQWTLLQQAGLVSGTLPYSSASQVTTSGSVASAVNDPNCVAAGCTGGPYPNCTCAAAAAASTGVGSALDSTVAGLPLYLWLIIGGGGLFLFSKRGR